MRAVVVAGKGRIEVREVPEPRLAGPGEAIVGVTAAAICGTDVSAKNGLIPGVHPGMINGHEFVGVIEEVGSQVEGFRPGDRVTAPPAFWCGRCPPCRRGQIQYCELGGYYGGGEIYGRNVPGVQAQYARVVHADRCLTRVPDAVPDEEAVLVADVFQTGFHAACEGRINAGDTVVVFGCGPVGLGAVVSSWLFGARRVLAVDVLENRLRVAAHYGALPLNAREGDVVAAIKEATGGAGADVTIEAVGAPETFELALRSVRRGGHVSIVGIFHRPGTVPLPELCFHGAYISLGLGYVGRTPELMGLVEKRRVSLREIATHVFSLAEAEPAYELFEKHKDQCLKVILKP